MDFFIYGRNCCLFLFEISTWGRNLGPKLRSPWVDLKKLQTSQKRFCIPSQKFWVSFDFEENKKWLAQEFFNNRQKSNYNIFQRIVNWDTIQRFRISLNSIIIYLHWRPRFVPFTTYLLALSSLDQMGHKSGAFFLQSYIVVNQEPNLESIFTIHHTFF